MVTKEVEVEKLQIVTTWIYISLFSMVSFAYLALLPLMRKLHKQYTHPENTKPKHKRLGEYSEHDPVRFLKGRPSIYSLAFFVNLKNGFLDDIDVATEARPSNAIRFEVNVTALFCAFSQVLTSVLLLQDFMKVRT